MYASSWIHFPISHGELWMEVDWNCYLQYMLSSLLHDLENALSPAAVEYHVCYYSRQALHACSPLVHAAASYRSSAVQCSAVHVQCMCTMRAGQGGEEVTVIPCFPATMSVFEAGLRLQEMLLIITNTRTGQRKQATTMSQIAIL
jgi:hypothetical protein